MRYKVNVIATEYALNLKVPAYHMGTIIDENLRPQRVGATLVVSESSERHCVSNAVASTSKVIACYHSDPLLGAAPLRPPRACNNPKESSEMQTRNKSFLLRLTEQEYATLKSKKVNWQV